MTGSVAMATGVRAHAANIHSRTIPITGASDGVCSHGDRREGARGEHSPTYNTNNRGW